MLLIQSYLHEYLFLIPLVVLVLSETTKIIEVQAIEREIVTSGTPSSAPPTTPPAATPPAGQATV